MIPQPTAMNCHKCSTEVPAGHRFCGGCGISVSDPSAATLVADPAAASLMQELAERLADEYRIERELGRGGMGIVYQATEIALHRAVALKVLPPELAHVPAIAERFKREARLAASLDHPNIIPIFRVGQAGRTLFIAMKYVEGCPLDTILERRGALPVAVALLVLRGAASALAFAHERGVVHRDIKGGNILLERSGRIIVTDFGIARAAEDAAITSTGSVVGTPHFMSPEQCSGQQVGPPSDQYALGVLAFQMLAGSLPFDADSLPGIMQHHFFTPVPDLGTHRPEIPSSLRAIVTRALAKEPAARYATTADMVAALRAVPFTDADRAAGEEALRDLVAGRGLDAGGIQRPAPAARRTAKPARGSMTRGATLSQVLARSPRFRWLAAAVVVVVGVLVGAAAAVRGPSGSELRRGIEYYRSGRPEAAALVFEKVAREQPGLAEPHIYLGRLARERGDFDRARQEVERALRLDSDNAVASREMAAVMLATGRLALARRFYMRALRLDPEDRTAKGYLACTLMKLGERRLAERAAAEAGSGPWDACVAGR